MIAAFDNLFKQVVLGADKRWVASQEDEQHHTTAPHVHWFTVGLPLHHLRGHVLRRTDTTWNDCVMFTWTVEELETQDFPLYLSHYIEPTGEPKLLIKTYKKVFIKL